MKLVVIGLGSMGRRRIRLIQRLHPQWKICAVDISEERRIFVESEFHVQVFEDLKSVFKEFRPAAALVCTSPLGHGSVVLDCLNAGLHVFTELNLVSNWYAEAEAIAKKKGLKIFVSSTFLFRKELQYIAKAVNGRRVNYIYHSGQYLPDWHPWESYKNFFVSDKRTNACREILAIELPWMVRAFGEIQSIYVLTDRNSGLDIDFNDNYIISIQHVSGNKGVFCQDIVSRCGLRRLEVYSEDLHLFWDGTPQTLSVWNVKSKKMTPVQIYKNVEQDGKYNSNIIENMYMDELKAFFGYISGHITPLYTLEDDRKTLSLIDLIEKGGVK